MFLAGLLAQRDLPLRDLLDCYELYAYKQWLLVYMRSKMIKHTRRAPASRGSSMGSLPQAIPSRPGLMGSHPG